MKNNYKLNQRKINIIFSALIGALLMYSAFVTYFIIESHRGLEAVDQDLATELFKMRTKGTPQ